MAELLPNGLPTRMLVFDGVLSCDQATSIRWIYRKLYQLPEPVLLAIVKDLAAAHIDGDVSR